MKAYFTQLFNYDRYANHLILDALISANSTPKAVQTMGHLLAAQQIWFSRCTGGPPAGMALWPDITVDSIGEIIDNNHTAWVAYLDTLMPADFERIIYYKTFQGTDFESKLVDVLSHVINHGTHHRGQIGALIKLAGTETLPSTDYILYVRNL